MATWPTERTRISPTVASGDATRHDEPIEARAIGAAVSLALHAILIALVLMALDSARHGGPARSMPKAVLISLAPTSAATVPRTVPPTVQAAAPQPRPELPRILPKPTTVPLPVPAPVKPKVAQKSAALPPAASAASRPPGAITQKPALVPAPPQETPEESLIGRIHENWLQPVSARATFRCRVHIDYLVGGHISNVLFRSPCGDYDLQESVRKAIWKTQPLPLATARTAAGSIEIEFAP